MKNGTTMFYLDEDSVQGVEIEDYICNSLDRNVFLLQGTILKVLLEKELNPFTTITANWGYFNCTSPVLA